MDAFVGAGDADVEVGELVAGAYFGAIVLDFDDGDEVVVAVFCDEVDVEDFAVVIFGGGVGESGVDLGGADGVGAEGVAEGDVVASRRRGLRRVWDFR